MTVCVLDVGGGTADITVHDVEERAGRTVLAEALHAVGALAGSAYVDTAFRCGRASGEHGSGQCFHMPTAACRRARLNVWGS